jgi:hypothetical protein
MTIVITQDKKTPLRESGDKPGREKTKEGP